MSKTNKDILEIWALLSSKYGIEYLTEQLEVSENPDTKVEEDIVEIASNLVGGMDYLQGSWDVYKQVYKLLPKPENTTEHYYRSSCGCEDEKYGPV